MSDYIQHDTDIHHDELLGLACISTHCFKVNSQVQCSGLPCTLDGQQYSMAGALLIVDCNGVHCWTAGHLLHGKSLTRQ